MPAPITSLAGPSFPAPIRPAGESRPGGGFRDALATAIQSVEGYGREASSSAQSFLAGEEQDLHTTILATQKAELALEMFLQVRNKVVNAYQEIMRMQM
jgi:flagellar hook-basal body complex protein FliE